MVLDATGILMSSVQNPAVMEFFFMKFRLGMPGGMLALVPSSMPLIVPV